MKEWSKEREEVRNGNRMDFEEITASYGDCSLELYLLLLEGVP